MSSPTLFTRRSSFTEMLGEEQPQSLKRLMHLYRPRERKNLTPLEWLEVEGSSHCRYQVNYDFKGSSWEGYRVKSDVISTTE